MLERILCSFHLSICLQWTVFFIGGGFSYFVFIIVASVVAVFLLSCLVLFCGFFHWFLSLASRIVVVVSWNDVV